MKIARRHKIELSELILFCRENIGQIEDDFCLYCQDSDVPLSQGMWIYVEEYPVGDDAGNDVFPDFVVKNELELLYYGEQFVDVLNNVLMQAIDPGCGLIVEALDYYMNNDDFMVI
ncbi:MAG: hypothetical protein ABN482_06815 [Corticimicrobacter sp.]|uniref:DUF7716 domain-containing protein n=1 Tax=Corticimicrobacter sp. TaxID=2678536 RepID=UPI0032DAAADB